MGIWNKWFGKSRKTKAAEAQAAAEAARAKRMAEAAMVDTKDSENARLAEDRRLKKLGRSRGLAGTEAGPASKALLGQ